MIQLKQTSYQQSPVESHIAVVSESDGELNYFFTKSICSTKVLELPMGKNPGFAKLIKLVQSFPLVLLEYTKDFQNLQRGKNRQSFKFIKF